MSMSATLTVGDPQLVNREGTIIPQGLTFASGARLVLYHVGVDGWFSPCGASRSGDGTTWQPTKAPLWRCGATGRTGVESAIFLDQYLIRTGTGKYAAFANRTKDGGVTFGEPFLASFAAKNLLNYRYTPRPTNDPDAFVEPPVPEWYAAVTDKHGCQVGGHLFGRVIRLPDGALGVSAYCQVEGNVLVAKRSNTYVGERSDEANAPEGRETTHWSALFFRSEDEGVTWEEAGTIGRADIGQPFDWEHRYSEGFTETGVSVTATGELYALMRQGSYLLMYSARSRDGGRSWTPPDAFSFPGVAPSLCLLGNGVLAAAWGRPGLNVGFSLDGTGETWDIITGLETDRFSSQKYGWLSAASDDTLALYYDERSWDSTARRHRDHGIYCRTLRIQPS